MSKNTKNLVWFVVIILLVITGFYYFKNNGVKDQGADDTANMPPTTPENPSLKHFTDSKGSVSFDYNPDFTAKDGSSLPTSDWRVDAQGAGVILATVSVDRAYMPNTNFSEAHLTVGKSSDQKEIQGCVSGDTMGNEKNEGQATISGYPFTKFTFGDAGAGNFYETTSYRGTVGGDCYIVEYTIHSTNIGNYSPDQGIKEFNKVQIQGELENIVKSIKFLTSSN